MQPIISAMVASTERMRFFFGFGRPSEGARLRTSWKIAVPMVASAPMMAATIVSDRPIYVASGKRPASVFRRFRAAAQGLSGVCTGSHFVLPRDGLGVADASGASPHERELAVTTEWQNSGAAILGDHMRIKGLLIACIAVAFIGCTAQPPTDSTSEHSLPK